MTDYETAVSEIRTHSEFALLIQDAYLDADPLAACERFGASQEFAEVARLLDLHHKRDRRLLDLGAGNGIASLAFARYGLRVIALEPGRGSSVGAPAIQAAARRAGVSVAVCASNGEALALQDGSVDIIYARQVLHHAADLRTMLHECARVLRSGGTLLATREPVVDNEAQRAVFLAQHPLHSRGVHEDAWPLRTYREAFRNASLRVRMIIGPWESVINYAPLTAPQIAEQAQTWARRWLGPIATCALLRWTWPRLYRWRLSLVRSPGRHFTFLARKP